MFHRINNLLKQPYPFDYRPRAIFNHSLSIGLFIFLFLFIFQPFELQPVNESLLTKTLVYLGYGMITFIVSFLYHFLLPLLFPQIIRQEQVQIKYEILFSIGILFIIGIANAIYHNSLYPEHTILKSILYFQYFTFTIGFFPIILFLMLDVIMKQRRNLIDASKMNSEIRKQVIDKDSNSQIITLTSDNEKESMTIPTDKLLYIKSAGNYVTVYFNQNGKIHFELLRTPIKRIQSLLIDYPHILRCHRMYIINLQNINSVVGDSQGYQISLKDTSETIPVSRGYLKPFRQAVDQI